MRGHEGERRRAARVGPKTAWLGALTTALLLLAGPAGASDPFAFTADNRVDVFGFDEALAFDDPFAFDEVLPEQFQYDEGLVLQPSLLLWQDSYRRQKLTAHPAPSRYRTDSILRYTRKLENGMVVRVKLPMRLRKLVKLELRF